MTKHNMKITIESIHENSGGREKFTDEGRGLLTKTDEGFLAEYACGEDKQSGGENLQKNRLLYKGGRLSIKKIENSREISNIRFKNNTVYKSRYATPYGDIDIETRTKRLDVHIYPEVIDILICYDLCNNGVKLSRVDMKIKIKNDVTQ